MTAHKDRSSGTAVSSQNSPRAIGPAPNKPGTGRPSLPIASPSGLVAMPRPSGSGRISLIQQRPRQWVGDAGEIALGTGAVDEHIGGELAGRAAAATRDILGNQSLVAKGNRLHPASEDREFALADSRVQALCHRRGCPMPMHLPVRTHMTEEAAPFDAISACQIAWM